MFLVVGIWGSRERKIRASYQFFIYTLVGSVLMLLAILTMYAQTGTTGLNNLCVLGKFVFCPLCNVFFPNGHACVSFRARPQRKPHRSGQLDAIACLGLCVFPERVPLWHSD